MLVAKSAAAQRALSDALKERRVEKRYRCMCRGRLQGSGTVDVPLRGETALTRWVAVEHSPPGAPLQLTLVDAYPATGALPRHAAAPPHRHDAQMQLRADGAAQGASTRSGGTWQCSDTPSWATRGAPPHCDTTHDGMHSWLKLPSLGLPQVRRRWKGRGDAAPGAARERGGGGFGGGGGERKRLRGGGGGRGGRADAVPVGF